MPVFDVFVGASTELNVSISDCLLDTGKLLRNSELQAGVSFLKVASNDRGNLFKNAGNSLDSLVMFERNLGCIHVFPVPFGRRQALVAQDSWTIMAVNCQAVHCVASCSVVNSAVQERRRRFHEQMFAKISRK